MELKANLSFSKESIADILKRTVEEKGYMLCSEFRWTEQGGVEIDVRPMLPEEKEERGMDPRNVAEIIHDSMTTLLGQFKQEIKSLLEEVNFRNSDPEPEAYRTTTVKPETPAATISLVTPEDYDLTTEEGRARYKRRLQIEEIRKEQEKAPEIYGDNVRDQDGFVVFGQTKEETDV